MKMANRSRPEADPGKPLVLLVDDYADNREAYALYLRFKGYRVVEAADGHQALERAFRTRPQIIIMDLSLPGLDGWEATRTLKQDPRTQEVPVIALTGHALEGQSESARAAGCDAFLTKPCEPSTLETAIRKILEDLAASQKGERRRS
jgi:two-component system, cell cycle response regulator DivK